jgi:hypothetical protein
MRGRVSAVSSLFVGTSNLVGEFESGVTASWFGAVASVLIGGIGTLAVVLWWLRLFPELRRYDGVETVGGRRRRPQLAAKRRRKGSNGPAAMNEIADCIADPESQQNAGEGLLLDPPANVFRCSFAAAIGLTGDLARLAGDFSRVLGQVLHRVGRLAAQMLRRIAGGSGDPMCLVRETLRRCLRGLAESAGMLKVGFGGAGRLLRQILNVRTRYRHVSSSSEFSA